MPLADFPGRRNWGYDGVLPFAPDASYGTPDDLRSLIARAHARNLMVLVDVVYNHFGPDGNYLHRIAQPFFTDRHKTPWGAAIDFEEPRASRCASSSSTTRSTGSRNSTPTDCGSTPCTRSSTPLADFLTELARRVREGPGREREIHLVLENDRNDAHASRATARALVHRAMERRLPPRRASSADGERNGLLRRLRGTPARLLGRCLAEGFALPGRAVAVSQARAARRAQARTCRPRRS
jgi:hypothetical protein